MPSMSILNPRKRGAKRKKPSPAQLAARKKFAALAKARRAKLNPKKRRKSKRRAALKLNPVAPMAKRSKSRRRRSPLRLFRRKARRNPLLPKSFMDTHLHPAIVGAAGAIANDIAVGFIVQKLPAGLQKPEVRHLVKAVTAIGLGMAASKARVAQGSTIRAATVGALTCSLHDAARTQVQKTLPTVALGEYLSEVIGPWQGMRSYAPNLGQYLSGTDMIGASDQFVTAGEAIS